jgi:two-component system response regulator DevR
MVRRNSHARTVSSPPEQRAPEVARNSAGPIWVLVIDDNEVFTAHLAQTMAGEDDLRTIGAAGSIAEARWMLVNAIPDVVLVNQRLPDGDAVAALSELQAVQPVARFVLLTSAIADDALVRAVEAGACGFVEKALSLSALCAAVRAAHAGEAVIAPKVLRRLLPLMARRPPLRPTRVTPRDCDLLVLMANGLTNAQIAERAAHGVSGVELHVAALCAKLGAHSKLEALSVACRQGLLPRPA